MIPNLILIRGLPGSGKSTIAKRDYPLYKHFEADQYFMNDGIYKFDHTKIKKAHEECREKTIAALKNGDNVVVANTFTQQWEMKPYFEMLYPVKIITAKGKYKNIHGVPADVIKNMQKRWED